MRISDLLISGNYLSSINTAKSRIAQLQSQVATGNKINRPSDSPSGTAKILKLLNGIARSDSFSENIQNSLSFLDETSSALENVQSEVIKVLTNLTEINNVTNNGNLGSFSDQIDLSLQAILDSANRKYDGKFLFGGTDFSSDPYGLTSDSSAIEVKVNSVSGVQKVKLSQNIIQKINLTGTEVFGTIISQTGELDANNTPGDTSSSQLTIYDAQGNPYTLNAEYTKTSANTYTLNYDVADSGGTSIFSSPPSAKTITFNPDSGRLTSIDGSTSFDFNIKDSAHNIDFNFHLSGLKEKSPASALTLSANQTNDIFNTLIHIRDNLRLGIKPDEEEQQIVSDFNIRVLNKISAAGNIINQLTDTTDLLTNQKAGFEELLSKEQDTDVAKAIMDLQNQDYLLQATYKLASEFLPKSILDYL